MIFESKQVSVDCTDLNKTGKKTRTMQANGGVLGAGVLLVFV